MGDGYGVQGCCGNGTCRRSERETDLGRRTLRGCFGLWTVLVAASIGRVGNAASRVVSDLRWRYGET